MGKIDKVAIVTIAISNYKTNQANHKIGAALIPSCYFLTKKNGSETTHEVFFIQKVWVGNDPQSTM